jgi:hypothetical protein
MIRPGVPVTAWWLFCFSLHLLMANEAVAEAHIGLEDLFSVNCFLLFHEDIFFFADEFRFRFRIA